VDDCFDRAKQSSHRGDGSLLTVVQSEHVGTDDRVLASTRREHCDLAVSIHLVGPRLTVSVIYTL
jgi:hypothetical protein